MPSPAPATGPEERASVLDFRRVSMIEGNDLSAAWHDPQSLVGREFHGCRIEAEVGRGGMGVVYRAEQTALERKVALKLIAPTLARDPAFRLRFERESRVAAAIDHPHAVPVYEAGEDDGQLFILMRYVAGADLGSVLAERGPLAPARAARVVAQVGSALDAAHASGLVHRDVKPGNILLSDEGPDEHAYLSDFGLTKDAASASALTHTGQWVGTLDYVAPEQLEGRPIDARTDVYALGCVLFQALTGRVPYPGTEVAKMWAHVSGAAPSLAVDDPDLAAFDAVVTRALAKSSDERYPSTGDLGRSALAAAEGRRLSGGERSVATGAAAPGIGLLDAPVSAAATRAAPPRRTAPPRKPPPPASAPVPPAEDRRGGQRLALGVLAAVLLLSLAAGAVFVGAWLAGEDERPRVEAPPDGPEPEEDTEPVAVPPVLGGSTSSARAKLERSGLDVTVTKTFSDLPIGQVVDQRPAPSEEVAPGTPVTLIVSKGPEQQPLTSDTPLTTSSFGRVTVGMTEEEAEAATGDELMSLGPQAGDGSCSYVEVEGLPGISMMLTDGEIARFDVSKAGIETKSGVTVGMSTGMLADAYGDQLEEEDHFYNPEGSNYTFVPEDKSDPTRIVFETDGDEEVTYIRAGRKPEVELVEGCA